MENWYLAHRASQLPTCCVHKHLSDTYSVSKKITNWWKECNSTSKLRTHKRTHLFIIKFPQHCYEREYLRSHCEFTQGLRLCTFHVSSLGSFYQQHNLLRRRLWVFLSLFRITIKKDPRTCKQERNIHAKLIPLSDELSTISFHFLYMTAVLFLGIGCFYKVNLHNRRTKQSFIYICSYSGWYRSRACVRAITILQSFIVCWFNIGLVQRSPRS